MRRDATIMGKVLLPADLGTATPGLREKNRTRSIWDNVGTKTIVGGERNRLMESCWPRRHGEETSFINPGLGYQTHRKKKEEEIFEGGLKRDKGRMGIPDEGT